ncbi:MAG: lactate utilization protein [Nitrososphaerota archaeon]|jgi:L-lactate dehydrogenase complex protein LldG|nr:lactate utilization protein [Nitrososphaerota archaeon]MDG6966490.1 lactate utilization protein [Nitrososphaerota archaeon]MDG6978651.1 lactate utilization protein [Nitrososphaerota archaeon]MDG7006356.1 lactate utilization protein [Nitrososphaerota archaeon]MDG7020394.1 lactate utilization protein [Nitrososphaerota archaeon]
MQRPTELRDQQGAGVVERFLASLRDLHVEGHVVKDEAETTRVIKGLLSKSRSVVVAGIPPRYARAVKDALGGVKADSLEDLQGRPASEVVKVLDAADTGVTWAVAGVALEGALLEVVYDDAFKLASSLPIVHVALLEAASLVPDLAAAMPTVDRLVKEAPPERKPIISFISGPSKTGDIEMRLLYGVHGPHTVHAVILDWS